MKGTLYGLGVGPGDPELITLKAHRILTSVPVVAYPAPDSGKSFARSIVAQWISPQQLEIPIVVPMRTERFPAQEIYDAAATTISRHLDAGTDVGVLCEGDPFFYGSFMYLFGRLGNRYDCEIVPGISSVMAGGAALMRPLAARNDVLTVIPGALDNRAIRARLEQCDAAAIIKVGRHFGRIAGLLKEMGLAGNSAYAERITLVEQKLLPLDAVGSDIAPYFSLILVYKGTESWVVRSIPNTEGDAA
jgi:precorrin-2/cobalt-factor-2 C20-methyltransferase